ncbi:MAG: helix-turn-helix transcriptional regulator [Stecheria intestinalis]|jgi:transcriptional regulator with XRE-family HTH domain|uniref:helix-turn-helix domain-containing protein n=1 Tax=Stecheria intestinalis TaxID=2606630 RepID=UPI0023F4796E|nr:helix-turn-helix transcriptional regulator [Stecheria intestinalis]MDD5881456.1 helix-turn-helix transcriptional regulator [Stecheria intestinalis]MDD6366966.1 helix-turn-helix transcriptional regulator [Stecheria intestinalis]
MFRIKELRESKNMSQKELAEKSHVSVSLINQYENDRRQNANTETLDRIAKALDCKIVELFDASKL